MNTCTRLFAVMVLAALALPGFAESFALKSAEGRFAITFPAQPRQTTEQQKQGMMHLYVLDHGGGAWVASYFDLPKRKRSGGSVRALEQWAKGAASGGELRRDSRVKVSGASGREVLVGLDKSQVRRQRVLIAKGRLYQIIYVGPAGSEATAEVNGFFDSFRLQQR